MKYEDNLSQPTELVWGGDSAASMSVRRQAMDVMQLRVANKVRNDRYYPNVALIECARDEVVAELLKHIESYVEVDVRDGFDTKIVEASLHLPYVHNEAVSQRDQEIENLEQRNELLKRHIRMLNQELGDLKYRTLPANVRLAHALEYYLSRWWNKVVQLGDRLEWKDGS